MQEFGLPRSAVVPALGAFNIGVQVGQVAIVSLVIPLLIGLDWLIVATRRRVSGENGGNGPHLVRHHRDPRLLLDPCAHFSCGVSAALGSLA